MFGWGTYDVSQNGGECLPAAESCHSWEHSTKTYEFGTWCLLLWWHRCTRLMVLFNLN